MSNFREFAPIYTSFGEDLLLTLPILDIGQKMGFTDYLDFIKATDMTHPIMKGVDAYSRPFLAIKFNVKKKGIISQAVGTFFQRYTDDTKNWAYGTCYNHSDSIYVESRVRLYDYEDLTKRLKLFLDGSEINGYDIEKYDSVRGGNEGCIISRIF
jgi:hypothetical protein